MSNKKFNKFLSMLLAGTMVLGMSVTAFAAEETPAGTGSTTGDGAFEGHVDKNVLLVQLPTVAADDKTFAYTMDPEGLIAATEGAKDKDASFEKGATVYFLSAEKTYTSDSAKLKVVNKGTVDADVTVKAETAANTKVAMASSSTFTGTDAELYLGLKVADKDTVAVQATGAATPASITVGLKGAADNFEVKYNEATQKYSYAEKADVPESAWNSFEFGLTGACNPDGDYSEADLTASDVTVTWSYAKRAADSSADMLDENATTEPVVQEPSITDATAAAEGEDHDYTATFTKGTDLVFTVDFGNQGATEIQSFMLGATIGTLKENTVLISNAGNVVTLKGTAWGTAASGDVRYCKITFDDGNSLMVKITIQ